MIKVHSYRIRFKEHVGEQTIEDLVTGLLAPQSARLSETSTPMEYELELRKPMRSERFEVALKYWTSRGILEWVRIEAGL
jgi:hypothetical protein